MLPICYEAGLISGHSNDTAQFMTVATESFIKDVLASIFSRTRSNGPGDSGSAGFGGGAGWVQTHKYRRQLAREEDAAMRGEITRDKSGLLPIEAKAAGERGPLGMADLRIALEMGDCGTATFPIIAQSLMYSYREGELENWEDYTWLDGQERAPAGNLPNVGSGTNGLDKLLTNGVDHGDAMEVDDEFYWEGANPEDGEFLDSVLDSCLAV